ncbi:MAG: tetratricopeptide repeat protein [Oleiphilaceae bacterium]|nr:tetratricopeptide repeat protein [Oleiphilaceae bacterium]
MSESPVIFDVTLQNFQEKVLTASSSVPVLLSVYADWAEPCKQLQPVLEKLAGEYQGAFVLGVINADQQQDLVAQLQVQSLPDVKLVKDGGLVEQISQVLPEADIRKLLDKHVEAPRESDRDRALRLWQEGDLDEALAIYAELNHQNPEDYEVLVNIGLIQAEQGELAGARQILDSLPPEEKLRPAAKQLAARLKFFDETGDLAPKSELEARLEKNPADCDAMHQLAQHCILKGDNESAMQWLLRGMQTDKHYKDGASQKMLIELFDMLGNKDPLVRQYRRKMFTLMY